MSFESNTEQVIVPQRIEGELEQIDTDPAVSSGAIEARIKLQNWEQNQFGGEKSSDVFFSSADDLPPEAREKWNSLHQAETYKNEDFNG